MYLPNLPPDVVAQLIAGMQRPEGTLEFRAAFPGLLDPGPGTGLLLEVVARAQVFRLLRDEQLRLLFIHASPGTGTWMATVDLADFASPVEEWFIALVWSPEELRLHVGSVPPQGDLRKGIGGPASFELQAGRDGNIHEIGDSGVDVAGLRLYADGVQIVSPPALKLWSDTKLAVETLRAGGLAEGNVLLEVVVSNAALSMLTTGFEIYLKHRFLELDREGIPANRLALAHSFLSRCKQQGLHDQCLVELETEARDRNLSLLELLADRIKFQSYADAKRAFNRGFGVRFGDLVSSQLLDELQQLLGYRHRIIHVSPILGMLNQERVPPEDPVFSTRALIERAIHAFDKFITAVHEATLRLRPGRGASAPLERPGRRGWTETCPRPESPESPKGACDNGA